MQSDPDGSRAKILFWAKNILLIVLGCFFLVFGLHILIGAYSLQDPFSFILTFFASNFIILISATVIFVSAYRIKASRTRSSGKDKPQP